MVQGSQVRPVGAGPAAVAAGDPGGIDDGLGDVPVRDQELDDGRNWVSGAVHYVVLTTPLDAAVDEALRDYLARRKTSMPDSWY